MSTPDPTAREPSRQLMPPPATAALPTRRRWHWWPRVITSLALFLSGAVIGGAVTGVIIVRRIQDGMRNPERSTDIARAHFRRQLSLDAEQLEHVSNVLERLRLRLLAVRRRTHPIVQRELELARDDILPVLSQPQRQKFLDRFDQLRRDWFPAPPPPPAPGEAGEPGSDPTADWYEQLDFDYPPVSGTPATVKPPDGNASSASGAQR